MTLNFPNTSRSYDTVRHRVRFWGYDRALEISFFIEAGGLLKIAPRTQLDEAAFLDAFDSRVDRIHEAAARVYARHHKPAYTLGAADF